MLHTIEIGTCLSVQGLFAGRLPDGRIRVRVGERIYVGRPVERAAAEPRDGGRRGPPAPPSA